MKSILINGSVLALKFTEIPNLSPRHIQQEIIKGAGCEPPVVTKTDLAAQTFTPGISSDLTITWAAFVPDDTCTLTYVATVPSSPNDLTAVVTTNLVARTFVLSTTNAALAASGYSFTVNAVTPNGSTIASPTLTIALTINDPCEPPNGPTTTVTTVSN